MRQDTVRVIVKFITIMQDYSGRRMVEMDLPADPVAAVRTIIDRYRIPWHGRLDKSARIFINRQISDVYIRSGKKLEAGDQIIFIPISGGG